MYIHTYKETDKETRLQTGSSHFRKWHMIVNIQWAVLRFFFSFSLVDHPNSSGNTTTVTECYFVIGPTSYTEKQNIGNHINETQFGEIFTLNIAKYDS